MSDVQWKWWHPILAILVAIILPYVIKLMSRRSRAPRTMKTMKDYMRAGLNELDAQFQVGVDYVACQHSVKLSNEQQLTLYAFYKQAVLGPMPPNTSQPSAIDMIGRAKHAAWSAMGAMPRETAKQQYIQLVIELFPQFDITGERNVLTSGQPSPQDKNVDMDAAMAGVVSMPTVDKSAPEWQVTEDVFHFASTGDLTKVEQLLSDRADIVNAKDDGGRTMLHWAVDRSRQSMVNLLLRHRANPNLQDSDGMTPLHYAVSCEDEEITQLLVDHGAFTDIADQDGETPLDCASNEALETILASGISQSG